MKGKSYGPERPDFSGLASPAYDTPNVGSRVMANGGMVKGPDGYWTDSVVGAGQLTMQEIENELLEAADESGVSKHDDNFNMKEDGDGSAD